MSLSKVCCTLPPVASDYQEVGKYNQVNDFQVYESGDVNAKGTLIVIYDIFGFYNSTNQFVDNIGNKAGLRVLVPDFFRGEPTKPEDFPPKDRDQFVANLNSKASPEKCADIVKQVIQHYKIDTKSHPVALIGFCWGCHIAHQLTKHLEQEQFKAIAACHPSFWSAETGSELRVPLIAIPSKDEFDMNPFFDNLKPELREKSEHHRFETMHHGFCAARADLKDPENLKEYNRAIDLISTYFKKHLF